MKQIPRGDTKMRETVTDMRWIGRHELCAGHQLLDPWRCWLPLEPSFRGTTGQELGGGFEAVYHADATGAGDKVTEQGVWRRHRCAEQVVAELHEEEVHGQGVVRVTKT